MSMFDIVLEIIIWCIILNFLSTFIYAGSVAVINFLTRNRQKFNPWWLIEKKAMSHDTIGNATGGQIFLIDGIIGFTTIALLNTIVKDASDQAKEAITYGLIVLVLMVLSLFLLRFLLDLAHNLKHNHKTGKSKKIDEMQEEINQLKSLVKGE